MVYIIAAAAGAAAGVVIGYFIGAFATLKAIDAFIKGENNVERN